MKTHQPSNFFRVVMLLLPNVALLCIRAETVAYDDFVACGGEKEARDTGKLRAEGKEYVVAEGDVMNFRFNV